MQEMFSIKRIEGGVTYLGDTICKQTYVFYTVLSNFSKGSLLILRMLTIADKS